MVSLNCCVVLTEEATNELSFWHGMTRLEFERSIWSPTAGVSVRMTLNANDIRWGGHTMQGVVEHAYEYFSQEERRESLTFR